jgi:hypothetical protein
MRGTGHKFQYRTLGYFQSVFFDITRQCGIVAETIDWSKNIVSVQADFVKQPDVFINDGTASPFR